RSESGGANTRCFRSAEQSDFFCWGFARDRPQAGRSYLPQLWPFYVGRHRGEPARKSTTLPGIQRFGRLGWKTFGYVRNDSLVGKIRTSESESGGADLRRVRS